MNFVSVFFVSYDTAVIWSAVTVHKETLAARTPLVSALGSGVSRLRGDVKLERQRYLAAPTIIVVLSMHTLLLSRWGRADLSMHAASCPCSKRPDSVFNCFVVQDLTGHTFSNVFRTFFVL